MMSILRLAWWGLRGQRSRVLLVCFCLALGVAARVTVGSVLNDASAAVDRESRTMVGADLSLVSREPLSAERRAELAELLPPDSRTTDLRSLVTMTSSVDNSDGVPRSRLVILKGVGPEWPLRGSVTVSDGAGAESLFEGPNVLVAPDLLIQIDVALGDQIRLGSQTVTITGIIDDEPGLAGVAVTMGPTVLMDNSRLEDTGLTGFTSRVRNIHQVELPLEVDPDVIGGQLRSAWDIPERARRGFMRQMRASPGIELTTASEALATVKRFLDRFGDFLRLLALIALLLGAIGVASLVRGFISRQLPELALLGVCGASPRRLVGVALVQAGFLGVAAAVLGCVIGTVVHMAAVAIMSSSLPLELAGRPDPTSLLWGLGLGVGAALIAGAGPVLAIRRLRPLPVLRGDSSRLPGDRLAAAGLALAGLGIAALVAALETRSWTLGPAVVAGTTAGGLILAGLAAVALPLAGRLGRVVGNAGISQGLRNLGRPGYRPTAAVVAIGCATLLIGVLIVYRHSFRSTLDDSLQSRAPALYAIDIPDHEHDAFRDRAFELGAETFDSAPMVVARLRTINGADAKESMTAEDQRDQERQRWFRTREQRLSWRNELGPDEEIIEGAWLDPEGEGEVSIAKSFADSADISLDDELGLEIQGVPVEVTVTSIRKVDWLGLRLNFFMLLSPKTLEGAPTSWLATLHEIRGETKARVQTGLADQFPMVATIDVAAQVDKARTVFGRMSLAVGALGVVALGAGLAVLIGLALAAGRERRADAALLRVLGADNRTLVLASATEFGAAAALGAVVGAALAAAGGWALMELLIEADAILPWGQLAALAMAVVALGAGTGVLATGKARSAPPLAVLREE